MIADNGNLCLCLFDIIFFDAALAVLRETFFELGGGELLLVRHSHG